MEDNGKLPSLGKYVCEWGVDEKLPHNVKMISGFQELVVIKLERNKMIWPCHIFFLAKWIQSPLPLIPPHPPNVEQLFHGFRLCPLPLAHRWTVSPNSFLHWPSRNAAPLRGYLILIIAIKIPDLSANLSCVLWLWIAQQRWLLRQADNYKLY